MRPITIFLCSCILALMLFIFAGYLLGWPDGLPLAALILAFCSGGILAFGVAAADCAKTLDNEYEEDAGA